MCQKVVQQRDLVTNLLRVLGKNLRKLDIEALELLINALAKVY